MKSSATLRILLPAALLLLVQCRVDPPILSSVLQPEGIITPEYKTKNVVMVVIDGPRYSETWGDSSRKYIPNLSGKFSPQAVVNTNFRNDGYTHTTAGHTAITTGFHQQIDNYGSELPANPSVLQLWLKQSKEPASLAWVITSKIKLKVLSNTAHPEWNNKYLPRYDCGDTSLQTDRDDSLTLVRAKEIFTQHHPRITLVHFKQPDIAAHAGDWNGYVKAISDCDSYTWQLWSFLQSDPFYKDKTAFFVTNDHGRHLDGIADGFISHGDSCEGCRHIVLFASGPDFKKNFLTAISRSQIDLAATAAELMGVRVPGSTGNLMTEILLKQ